MSAARFCSSISFPGAALSVVLGALVGCMPSSSAPQRQPPHANVILFLSDALRAANLPMYGYGRDTAPNLAALAREGIVFEHHFAHYPGTPVSVSQMLTGRLVAPLLLGYRYLAVPVHALPDRLLVLPRAFKEHGYRTGIVTSHEWFAGSERLLREFDTSAVVSGSAGKSYAGYENLWQPIAEFLAANRRDRRPFFLYVHSMETHGPNDYHEGFDRFRNAPDRPEKINQYDAEIEYTDHWVGKVIDELRALGLLEQTIVAVTSDHGEDFGEMGPERWNFNHGLLVRRSQVHIPLVMRLPSGGPRGVRHGAVSRQIDLAPTLLRLGVAGADLGAYDIDGEDLSGGLLGRPDAGPPQRTAVAFSLRYWGIYEADVEVHYDTWQKSYSPLLRAVPDQFNYPRLEPVEDPARRDVLVAALTRAREESLRRLAALPSMDPAEMPGLVHLPIMLPLDPGSEAAPTFEDRPDDDRWHLVGEVLRAHPGERPGTVTFTTPWVAGPYKVSVMVGVRETGFRNEFDIAFPGNVPSGAVHVRGEDAGEDGFVDLGVHALMSNPLVVQIGNPTGGAAVRALALRRLDPAADAAEIDPELKERLRQLGYE